MNIAISLTSQYHPKIYKHFCNSLLNSHCDSITKTSRFVVRIRKSTLSVKYTAFGANEGGTYNYHCTIKGIQDVTEESIKNMMKEEDNTLQTSI